ncbi:MAG TPA: endonuclease/exonuclease/phosphatase family protein [Pseudonocardiaceae bacterium]|jgi:endonuclease/exonuclease/phosphatase family metal-dependent hydrolase|nr:endonuclease/exonuclease/phosphatase family protein [Pseudonocardiaceae bacterium]
MRKIPIAAAALGVLLACPAALALSAQARPAAANALTTAEPAAAPEQPGGLRVMSYNIQHGAGLDEVFDLDRTAAAIAAEHPDLVGLEEVDEHWGDRSDDLAETSALAAKLRMHAFFAPIYDLAPTADGAPDREYGLAILSRFPILDTQNHQITRLSTVATNPAPAAAPGFPEIAIRFGGRIVHVYATHLDYRSDPSVRAAQVSDMLGFLGHDPAPKILVGDFNADPDAPEIAPLLAGQTDVWTLLNQPHPPSWPSGTPTDRIDYITVSPGFGVRDAAVIDTQSSDHRPVIADLVLPH